MSTMYLTEQFQRGCALAAITGFVLLCMTSHAGAAETVSDSETLRIPAGDTPLHIENLAGKVTIERAGGRVFEIEVTKTAEADSRAEAGELLQTLKLTQTERRGRNELLVEYPVEQHRSYRYTQGGRSDYNNHSRYQGRKVRVSSKQRGDSVVLYADFVIRVPDDAKLRFETLAGDMNATGVRAELHLESASGAIETTGTAGRIRLDTGSGSISVARHDGRVVADTGSGQVLIEDVSGETSADTGSGQVQIRRVTGNVDADTGSGRIELEAVDAREIRADTGSGSIFVRDSGGSLFADTGSGTVSGSGLTLGEELWVDTGSGSVRLQGDLSRVNRLRVDTGSGSVQLVTSAAPSMRLDVESNNGNIQVDLPGIEDVRRGKDYFRASIGGGAGRGEIDTGSGSVSFTME